jgi:hypothetical protein
MAERWYAVLRREIHERSEGSTAQFSGTAERNFLLAKKLEREQAHCFVREIRRLEICEFEEVRRHLDLHRVHTVKLRQFDGFVIEFRATQLVFSTSFKTG